MLIWPGRIFSVSPSQIFSRILKYRGEHESKVKGIISFRTFINALIIFTNISVEFFAFVCFSGRSCWVFFLNIFLKIDNCNLKLHRLYSDQKAFISSTVVPWLLVFLRAQIFLVPQTRPYSCPKLWRYLNIETSLNITPSEGCVVQRQQNWSLSSLEIVTWMLNG